MKTRITALTSLAERFGTAMMVLWTLVLGPVGALLLLGVAHSISVGYLALGMICGLLLFSPLFMTLAWSPFGWTTILGNVA